MGAVTELSGSGSNRRQKVLQRNSKVLGNSGRCLSEIEENSMNVARKFKKENGNRTNTSTQNKKKEDS